MSWVWVDSVQDHSRRVWKVAMVRVPNDMLKGWSLVLGRVATYVEADQTVPRDLVRRLQRVTDQVNGLLAEAEDSEVIGRRRGLGRGLDALIPTHSPNPTDLEHLRLRLREIAGDTSTEQLTERKAEPQSPAGLGGRGSLPPSP